VPAGARSVRFEQLSRAAPQRLDVEAGVVWTVGDSESAARVDELQRDSQRPAQLILDLQQHRDRRQQRLDCQDVRGDHRVQAEALVAELARLCERLLQLVCR
jgi:hypothetical protein